jgi:putative DNA primase/helicase
MTVVEIPAPKVVIPTAQTVCMSAVAPQPIRWLWPFRIALGKLTIFAGDPGLGKSLLTASIAAHITTAHAWPDGTACPLGSMVLVSGEDDPGDTIRPRLDVAGADVSRVHLLEAVRDHNGIRGFDLSDVPALGALLDRIGDCKLVVIDPVSAYLAGTDSHKNSDIRALLTPLAQMAASHGVAIVAVSHLNKAQAGSALSRVTGSLAFVAAARAAYVVARCPDDPERRLVLPIKNNLGNDRTGLSYRIAEERGIPFVVWDRDPVTVTADQALSLPTEAPRSTRGDAVEFLTELLSAGPLLVDEIKVEATQAGFSWSTLRRAKDEIGAKSKKAGFDKAGWSWSLPKVLSPVHTHLSTFGESEHLRGLQAIEGAQGAQPAHGGEGEHLRQRTGSA